MRILLALALPLALLAQEPAQAKEATKTVKARAGQKKARLKKVRLSQSAPAVAQETKKEEKKEEKAESTAPVTEKVLSGHIDLGARWVGRAGDYNTYRSLVNLSQGVRLVAADAAYEPGEGKLVESLRLQMFNWGGDPYNTARLEAYKKGSYRFVGTYSNIAYYNALPSFADLGIDKGVYMNQRTMDTRIRNFSNELELFPGGRVIPYIGYERNSSYGTGITPLWLDANEYPLRNVTDWGLNEIRAGLRIEMNRWHVTLEQGGQKFEDNQSIYSTETITGNRSTPYFGQLLKLASGGSLYKVSGKGAHTKALLTANPVSWLDLAGTVIQTKPKTYGELNLDAAGTLVDPNNPLTLLVRQNDYFFGNASMPRFSASASAEARAGGRVRLRHSWETDRYHTNGVGSLRSALYTTPLLYSTETLNDAERLEVRRNRQQFEALVDVLKNFTVRGGYRYEWGDSLLKASPFAIGDGTERVELKRKTALAGFNVKPVKLLTVTGDFEITDGEKTFYRTGLMDTHRYRIQARLQLPKSVFFNANLTHFDNKNPDAGINYDYKAQAATASVQWMPGGGKNLTIIADYQRSAIRSDINYLYPLGLFSVASLYRDYAHTGTLMADVRLPFSKGYAGRLSFGGSFVSTGGTRPTDYYQPQGRIHLPVTRKLEFFSEWRYYGLSQNPYSFESFRSNQYTGGVRLLL